MLASCSRDFLCGGLHHFVVTDLVLRLVFLMRLSFAHFIIILFIFITLLHTAPYSTYTLYTLTKNWMERMERMGT